MSKLQASLKFDSSEDCNSFIELMSRIPFLENWDDVKNFKSNTSCHVCNSKNKVKQGIVPVIEAYTFWRLCNNCHEKGWNVPSHFFPKDVLKYDFYDRKKITSRSFHKNGIKTFQRPRISCLNTDSVIINVESYKLLSRKPR